MTLLIFIFFDSTNIFWLMFGIGIDMLWVAGLKNDDKVRKVPKIDFDSLLTEVENLKTDSKNQFAELREIIAENNRQIAELKESIDKKGG